MNLITLNRILTAIAAAGVSAAGALAAGQIPERLKPWAALLAALGTVCAKLAKTPSQAMAAAAPAPKTLAPLVPQGPTPPAGPTP